MEDVEKIQLEIKMHREGYADGEAAHEDVIVERDSLKAKLAETERDSQRDRADSKQRGWDEANRQLDAMATERDSLKAKLYALEDAIHKESAVAIEVEQRLRAERDEWRAKAIARREELTNVIADTERRVVEEIAEWLCRNFYQNLARLIKDDGAYRKQRARDGE